MGWTYTRDQSLKELIAERIETQENEHGKWVVLAHAVRGSNLWKVVEVTRKPSGEAERFLALDMIQNGGEKYGYGYKDIDESMGPYAYSCPLKFLDMVPDPGGYATEWRAKVREYHARRNQKLVVGQTVKLTNGKEYKIAKVRPLRAIGPDGVYYSIPRRMLLAPEQAVGA